jgi:uncharacterized protein YgbK (DUF1537 family)
MAVLIIADDLSGAADCAIGFATAGLRTVVTLDAAAMASYLAPSLKPDSASGSTYGADAAMGGAIETMAVDTDSRRLAPADAAQRACDAWRALHRPGHRLYKKIDSTLRGNWAAEVAALQALAGLALVAPAYPATGRTVREGRVYVHGAPLESTDTWQLEGAGQRADVREMLEAAGMLTEAVGLDILRGGSAALARQIAEAARRGVQALVVDAQTTDDLLALACGSATLAEPLFWVGSAGLAHALATLPGVSSKATHATMPDKLAAGGSGAVLIAVGSLSGIAAGQCAALLDGGCDVLELIIPSAVLRAGAVHADWHAWQRRVGARLGANADLLLRIGRDGAIDAAEGPQLSTALAALAAPHLRHVAGLIATGGETARAMLDAAGIRTLELLVEIEAGIARARPLEPGPAIVTKAGAFGGEYALHAAYRHLRNGVTVPRTGADQLTTNESTPQRPNGSSQIS